MQRHGGAVQRDSVREQFIEIDDGTDGRVALVFLGMTESLAGIVCRATK